MASSTSPAEPYNVWSDVPSSNHQPHKLNNSHTLSSNDNDETGEHIPREDDSLVRAGGGENGGKGGSPTRYSVQTIRQKKGRQLVSTMMGGNNNSSSSNGGVGGVGGTFSTTETMVLVEHSDGGNTFGGSSGESAISRSSSGSGGASGKKASTITSTTSTTTASSSKTIADETDVHVVGLDRTNPGVGGRFGGGFPSVGLYQGLGRLQGYSAMAFSTFAMIHLVPPMLGAVGGVDLANKALIWGRVYYQTYGLEQVLVTGSLFVHLGAGLCKAVIRLVWKVKSYYSSSSSSSLSSKGAIEDGAAITEESSSTTTTSSSDSASTSTITTTTTTTSGKFVSSSSGGGASAPGLFPYHRLVGWFLTPITIAHMAQMRLAPLEILGDSSMLDYSFVTYLHRIGRSGPYVLLVGFLAYHMLGGAPVAYNMLLPRGSSRRMKVQELVRSKRVRAAVAGVVSLVALVGTGRIMYAVGPIPLSRVYLSLLD